MAAQEERISSPCFLLSSADSPEVHAGINTVIFYSPQLFISLGKSQHDALIATIVTGVVNHCATYVSLWAADKKGRYTP